MQLDEACRRGEDSKECNIGGCMLLLSIWSWEHLPVGRPPHNDNHGEWNDHDDTLRRPTMVYAWDHVKREFGTSQKMYIHYINELDTLKAEYVSSFIFACFISILALCK